MKMEEKKQFNFRLRKTHIRLLNRFARELDCNRTQAIEYILEMLSQCEFRRETWMKTNLVHSPTGRVVDFYAGLYARSEEDET